MECGRGLETVIKLSKMMDYMVESANCHYSRWFSQTNMTS